MKKPKPPKIETPAPPPPPPMEEQVQAPVIGDAADLSLRANRKGKKSLRINLSPERGSGLNIPRN